MTNKYTNVVQYLTNIYLKSAGKCLDIYKNTIVRDEKMSMSEVMSIVSNPSKLININPSVLLWLYEALLTDNEYAYIIPSLELVFNKQEIAQAQKFNYQKVRNEEKINNESRGLATISIPNWRPNDYERVYDIELKERFLNMTNYCSTLNTVKYYISVFIQIGEYEHRLEKDISEFSVQELLNMFELLKWSTATTFYNRRTVIKNYIIWKLLKEGKYNENEAIPILKIKVDDITGTKKTLEAMYSSIEDLQQTLDSVFAYKDNAANDRFIMVKLVCYLAWLGFDYEEIRYLYKFDVNYLEKSITAWNTQYTITNIPDFVIDLCKQCSTAIEYHMETGFRKTYVYLNNQYLIRKINSAKSVIDAPVNAAYMTMYYTLWRECQNELPFTHPYRSKTISIDKIYKAGCYYRLYNFEQQTGESAIDHIQDICRGEYTNNKRIIYQDYLQWKNAFYPTEK